MKILKRILLVEDDELDIKLTLEAFKQSNLANDVTIVRDGEEALDYLYRRGTFADAPKEYPVVVLLDIKMPKMNGLEVLQLLKQDDALKRIPVVMLTSSREEPDLQTCYNLGVNAYVVKPVDIQHFLDAIKHLGVFWALVNEPPPECGGPSG